jgi:hypothetical protein
MAARELLALLVALLLTAASAAPVSSGAPDDGFDLFDADANRDLLQLVGEEERDDLSASLEDAGRNWSELASAIRDLADDQREAAVWLINRMPHLDRLEMTSEILKEHVVYAFSVREEMPYEVPDDMFRPYVLTYRVEEEPVERWRRALYERFAERALVAGDVRSAARAINGELSGLLEERDREFFGPRQGPLFTLASGKGTESEISILTSAALKAVGIPSREARVRALGEQEGGASWVEVFDGELWIPLYPLAPEAFADFGHVEREHAHNVTVVSTRSAFERSLVTENYTDAGTLELTFLREGAPAPRYEHFSIGVLNRGSIVPLDELEAQADDQGEFAATLGEGRYVLVAGVRDGLGNPFIMMSEVALAPGETRVVAFDVTDRDRAGTPDLAMREKLGPVLTAWVGFDLDSEPSVRMLPLILRALRSRAANVRSSFQYLGSDRQRLEEALPLLGAETQVTTLAPGDVGHYPDEDGDAVTIGPGGAPLPVVRIHARSGGTLVFESTGYDLNIDRAIVAAIDGYLAGIQTEGPGSE